MKHKSRSDQSGRQDVTLETLTTKSRVENINNNGGHFNAVAVYYLFYNFVVYYIKINVVDYHI